MTVKEFYDLLDTSEYSGFIYIVRKSDPDNNVTCIEEWSKVDKRYILNNKCANEKIVKIKIRPNGWDTDFILTVE